MTQERVRVGIIGAGNWSRYAHVPALLAWPDVDIVGITDADAGRAEQLAATVDGAVAYADLPTMLENAELHTLHVVTSRGQHFEPTILALEHGLDVLCEKPLGHTVAEARTIHETARVRNAIGHMGFTFRYSPVIRYMRDLVQEGSVGDLYHFQGFEQNALLIDPTTPLPAIGFSRATDSGALHGYGSHLLDLARWVVGEFEEVVGDMATYIKERPVLGEDRTLQVEVDDSTAVLGRFENGVQAVMQFSKIAMGKPPGLEIRLFGSRLGLWARLEDSPTGYEWLKVARLDDRNFVDLAIPARYTEGHEPARGSTWNYCRPMVRHFLDRRRTRAESDDDCDFLEGLRTQELLEAIEESHALRQWVSVGTRRET